MSEFQYLLPNASLSKDLFERTQKQLNNYVNKKKITKSPTFFLSLLMEGRQQRTSIICTWPQKLPGCPN